MIHFMDVLDTLRAHAGIHRVKFFVAVHSESDVVDPYGESGTRLDICAVVL